MCSPTVSVGKSPPDCGQYPVMKPDFLRNKELFSQPPLECILVIVPPVGLRTPASILRRVLFPDPHGPTKPSVPFLCRDRLIL